MNKIKEISIVKTGVFCKSVPQGDIVYLQAKHFSENGDLDAILYPDLEASDVTEKHLIRDGDVLFAAKGNKNFAACYNNSSYPAVASTSFLIIRDLNAKILPSYLVWFLNLPTTQKNIKEQAIGSSIVSISKSVIEELEIAIPPVKIQKCVLKIVGLYDKENKLKSQLALLKEQLIGHLIFSSIKNQDIQF